MATKREDVDSQRVDFSDASLAAAWRRCTRAILRDEFLAPMG